MYEVSQLEDISLRLIVLIMALIASNSYAHELESTTQFINLKPTNQVGWLQDFDGRVSINQKFDGGFQVSYLERFNFFEKRLGGYMTYHPNERLTLEARYLQGNGNQILPERQTILSAYYSAYDGLTPYLFYRDSRYSQTIVNTATLGMEIEKFKDIIFLPSFMLGRATFQSPAKTHDAYNYGLKMVYYKDHHFTFSAWGNKGREASQGIIGQSTLLVNTLSAGAGAGYNFTYSIKGELLFDHTNYEELKTQFHTTTLNLSWKF